MLCPDYHGRSRRHSRVRGSRSSHSVFGKVIDGMDVVNNIAERDPSFAREPGDVIKTIAIEEK